MMDDSSDREKFAVMILSIPDSIDGALELSSGVEYRKCDFRNFLNGFMKKELGRMRIAGAEGGNVGIFSKCRAEVPEAHLGKEDWHLIHSVEAYLTFLTLSRVMINSEPCVASGFIDDTRYDVKSILFLRSNALNSQFPHIPLTSDLILRVELMKNNFLKYCTTGGQFGRFNRGLSTLRRGYAEGDPAERIHFGFRAIDALFNTKQGRGKNDFSSFCKYLLEDVPESEHFANEVFSARGAIVHMHGANVLYPDQAALQAEQSVSILGNRILVFASELYCRILGNTQLLGMFRSESEIDNFWKSGDNLDLLGPKINLERIEKEADFLRKEFMWPGYHEAKGIIAE